MQDIVAVIFREQWPFKYLAFSLTHPVPILLLLCCLFIAALKQRKQEIDKLEHDRRVEEYLKRTYEPRTKTKENYKEKKRENLLIDKENEKSLVNQRKMKNDLKVSEKNKIVEQSLTRKEVVVLERVVFEERKEKQDAVKNKEKENQNTVIEETIEETEIVSKETDLDTSDMKDEVISEEVIKIEPEEPIVFNEHCYASFNSGFEKENLELTKKETEIMKLENDRKSPSPIIEVVEEIEDEKEFYVKKEPEPKPIFPMRSIEDENISVWNILQHGIDKEDLEYMKTAFENLESFGSGVVKDLHWAKHPGILSLHSIPLFCNAFLSFCVSYKPSFRVMCLDKCFPLIRSFIVERKRATIESRSIHTGCMVYGK